MIVFNETKNFKNSEKQDQKEQMEMLENAVWYVHLIIGDLA